MLLGLRRLEKMILLALGEFHGPRMEQSFALPCRTQALRSALVHGSPEEQVGRGAASIQLPGRCQSAADKVCGVTAVGCV